MKKLLTFTLLGILITGTVWAQEADLTPKTPKNVVEAYFARLKAGNFEGLAELMHPDELKKFKKLFLPLFDLKGHETLMNQLLEMFDGVNSTDEVKALSDVQFFTSFIKKNMGPQLLSLMQNADITPIGGVQDGDSVLHYVYRTTMNAQGMNLSTVDVLSLKAWGDRWGVMLTGEMEGMAQMIQTMITNMATAEETQENPDAQSPVDENVNSPENKPLAEPAAPVSAE